MSKKDKGKKGFFAEFREFIARGNVIDMAVGVVVGSAFTQIVNSLVNDIITPAIGYLIGGMDFTKYQIALSEDAIIAYGTFIQNIINFLIIAFVIFLLVRGLNKLHRKKEEPAPEPVKEPEPDPQLVLLQEIRDLLKNKN
jgi:large conductance mechanosensitive channel